jgi:hypothetical protein
MCNLRMLTLYSVTFKEGDDRPPREYLVEWVTQNFAVNASGPNQKKIQRGIFGVTIHK